MTSDIDKPPGKSVMPPTVPIKGVNVPDPTTGSEPKPKDLVDDATGHEAFEKAKSETAQRE